MFKTIINRNLFIIIIFISTLNNSDSRTTDPLTYYSYQVCLYFLSCINFIILEITENEYTFKKFFSSITSTNTGKSLNI